jgi:hypothetical protein
VLLRCQGWFRQGSRPYGAYASKAAKKQWACLKRQGGGYRAEVDRPKSPSGGSAGAEPGGVSEEQQGRSGTAAGPGAETQDSTAKYNHGGRSGAAAAGHNHRGESGTAAAGENCVRDSKSGTVAPSHIGAGGEMRNRGHAVQLRVREDSAYGEVWYGARHGGKFSRASPAVQIPALYRQVPCLLDSISIIDWHLKQQVPTAENPFARIAAQAWPVD